jgi:hypothetical protein
MPGGPTYTFLEHLPTEKLIEDVTLLHTRLIDLGVIYRNGEPFLADIEDDHG